ncbi:tRNA pseudouridine(38-40) synthase TruA [Hathewaya histolytica]|uniref:tRNA pseudouridine(38-40) synthase TruA n=1 Tax=Hathewaya histolytica TaxID=1498 RepID=UPI003B675F5B
MKNIKLTIEYDGTNYSGWQKQNNSLSVQEVIEKSLEELLLHEVQVVGCSRTDTGVHAKEYILNFKSDTRIPPEKIKYALNTKLPRDIVVLNSEEVSEEFHSRYSSKGKTYLYTILNREFPTAIDRNYVYHHKNYLNINKMREASEHILGKHDFSAFKNKGSSVKTSIRTVTDLKIEEDNNKIKIYVSADGFLYNMVRIIVGTLILVGESRIEAEDVKDIIDSKDRNKAGKTVPPQGLVLLKTWY